MDLHEQLTTQLRGQIRSGELAGRIPSIKHFAQRYEVSTKTVERSMASWKTRG